MGIRGAIRVSVAISISTAMLVLLRWHSIVVIWRTILQLSVCIIASIAAVIACRVRVLPRCLILLLSYVVIVVVVVVWCIKFVIPVVVVICGAVVSAHVICRLVTWRRVFIVRFIYKQWNSKVLDYCVNVDKLRIIWSMSFSHIKKNKLFHTKHGLRLKRGNGIAENGKTADKFT